MSIVLNEIGELFKDRVKHYVHRDWEGVCCLTTVPGNILLAHLLAANHVMLSEIGELSRNQINHLSVDIRIGEQLLHAAAFGLVEPVLVEEEG